MARNQQTHRLHLAVALGIMALMSRVVTAQTAVTTSGGTTNTVPVFTGSAAIGNSPITTTSTGNVGIGTTTPSSILSLAGSSPTITLMGNYGNTEEIILEENGDPAGSIASSWHGNGMVFTSPRDITQTGFHFVSSGGTEVMHVDTLTHGVAIGAGYATTTLDAPSNGLIVAGNVGIGTSSPAYTFDVNGKIHSSSGVVYQDGTTQTTAWTGVLCGGDYAEAVNAAGGKKSYEPGDVLVLASGSDSDVQKSYEPYSTMVAGIYATKPGVIGKRQSLKDESAEVPMAMVGIVPTKVTAENGVIHRGDLLVSSSRHGYAMKGTDRERMLGAVIGKAMGSLDSGQGVIEVLVTLQ